MSSAYSNMTFVGDPIISSRPLRHTNTSVDSFRTGARHALTSFDQQVRELQEVLAQEDDRYSATVTPQQSYQSQYVPQNRKNLFLSHEKPPVVEISLTSPTNSLGYVSDSSPSSHQLSSADSARRLMQSIESARQERRKREAAHFRAEADSISTRLALQAAAKSRYTTLDFPSPASSSTTPVAAPSYSKVAPYEPWMESSASSLSSYDESDYSGAGLVREVLESRSARSRSNSRERGLTSRGEVRKRSLSPAKQISAAVTAVASAPLSSLLSPVNRGRGSNAHPASHSHDNYAPPSRPAPYLQTSSNTGNGRNSAAAQQSTKYSVAVTAEAIMATARANALAAKPVTKWQQLYKAAEDRGYSIRPDSALSPTASAISAFSSASSPSASSASHWPFFSTRPSRINFELALKEHSIATARNRVSRSTSPPLSSRHSRPSALLSDSKVKSPVGSPSRPHSSAKPRPNSSLGTLTSPSFERVLAAAAGGIPFSDSRNSNSSGRKVSSAPVTHPTPLSAPDFASLIGNTSLIYLRHLSAATGCHIYGKAEYENPGGSIKDRPALAIIDAAEREGQLVAGQEGWIVEGTAGNTGIGLALVGASRGYKTIIVMADNNSQEKKDYLRSLGAILIEVPMVPFKNPNNYVHVAARVYRSLLKFFEENNSKAKVILADQWSNQANRRAHFTTTGPEIWEQTQGQVDAFCCGVGTGGSLSGISLFLKSKNPNIRTALIDPEGSALKNYFEQGELKSEGASISEGIGQGRLCDNLIRDEFRPDMCLRVLDKDALPIAYDLLEQEGIGIGSSSAVNVAGAFQLAKLLGPGHTVVTLLCDGSSRYQSKLYNPVFLKEKKLPIPHWLRDDNEEAVQRGELVEELKRVSLLPSQEVDSMMAEGFVPPKSSDELQQLPKPLSNQVSLELLSPARKQMPMFPISSPRSAYSSSPQRAVPPAPEAIPIGSFGSSSSDIPSIPVMMSDTHTLQQALVAQEVLFQQRLEKERQSWKEEKAKIWDHYKTDIEALLKSNEETLRNNQQQSQQRGTTPSPSRQYLSVASGSVAYAEATGKSLGDIARAMDDASEYQIDEGSAAYGEEEEEQQYSGEETDEFSRQLNHSHEAEVDADAELSSASRKLQHYSLVMPLNQIKWTRKKMSDY